MCVYVYVWHDNDDGGVLPSGGQRLRGCFSAQSTLTRLYGGGIVFLASAGHVLTRAGDAIQVSSLTESAERDSDQWVIRLNSGCTAFSSSCSIFSCCTSVGTTGCHPGAIEISGRVACSSDGRLSFDRGRARAFVLRHKPGGWAFACRCPGGLEAWSLFSGGGHGCRAV